MEEGDAQRARKRMALAAGGCAEVRRHAAAPFLAAMRSVPGELAQSLSRS
jgi:hypothetical protein